MTAEKELDAQLNELWKSCVATPLAKVAGLLYGHIDALAARVAALEGQNEPCTVLGERSRVAAKNASNANFWTDKCPEAKNEIARLEKVLGEIARLEKVLGETALIASQMETARDKTWSQNIDLRRRIEEALEKERDDARADAAQARKSFAEPLRGYGDCLTCTANTDAMEDVDALNADIKRLTGERDALAEKLEKRVMTIVYGKKKPRVPMGWSLDAAQAKLERVRARLLEETGTPAADLRRLVIEREKQGDMGTAYWCAIRADLLDILNG